MKKGNEHLPEETTNKAVAESLGLEYTPLS